MLYFFEKKTVLRLHLKESQVSKELVQLLRKLCFQERTMFSGLQGGSYQNNRNVELEHYEKKGF